ncbi:MAG: HEAT repeat domain-containing protein [Marinilabiliaceae bacterium]|nr:HEAT repeat domain-containing protein [Marinilabiliaceae bacterium]
MISINKKYQLVTVLLASFIIMIMPVNCLYSQTQNNDTNIIKSVSIVESIDNQSDESLINNGSVDTTQENPWLWEVNYFGKSFYLVNALMVVIVASIAIMFVLLALILLNRSRLERESKLRQFLLEKYQSLILDYLFVGSGIEGFYKIASNSFRRQVLIDTIIDISINLKGESGYKLQQLYIDLQLDKDSLAKAKSKKWHVKVKGFKELAFMNLKEGNDEILSALQSKNDILRMEAQIALVRLSEENPFEWLYFQTHPFSLWEQITLHSMLIQHEIKVPLFSQWLDSPNYTVVMFALRMIREYNQTDNEDAIFEVLHHEREEVRQLAVEVCGDLELASSLKILKSRYKYEIYPIKIEIIRSMAKVPRESMLGFLKLVLDKEDDVQLQIESTKAIENLGDAGIRELNKLMDSEYKNYQIIIRHVLDKRIV